MTPIGKIIKILLALIASAAVVMGLQGCKRETPPPSPAQPPRLAVSTAEAAPSPSKERVVEIKVTEKGFQPDPITLKKGEPVTLKVTRTTDNTCATEFVLDEHQLNQKLPLNETVAIRFTPAKTGELKYGCAMDKMISGRFVIE
jgi:plastocyanin domain-containing protein